MHSAIFQGLPILPGIGASDAAPGVDFDELTEAEDDLVDLLSEFSGGGEDDGLAFRRLGVDEMEQANGKGGSFAGAWLCLGDGVLFADDGDNTLLLNYGGLLEAESWVKECLP